MGLWSRLQRSLRADSALWRRALHAGVAHGPEAWVRYSPPVFGLAFAGALPSQRASVLRALRMVHGPRSPLEEARDVAAVFANFASAMTDSLLAGADRGYPATNRPVGNWNFLSAVAAGQGVIIATAQTAGWDVAGTFLDGHDREVWVIMEREANEQAQQLHDDARRRAGIRMMHVGDDPLAPLPLLRHLRRGGIVALKFDRCHHSMRTRSVRFFGHPWTIPEGPLALAQLSGSPIVPVFSRRLGFMEYETHAFPPLRLPRRADDATLQHVAQTLVGHLETFVRAHPTHWFRFHEGRSVA